MAPLETMIADVALAASLLSSAVLASSWGELCAFEPKGDTAALATFPNVLAFTPVRWGLALLGLCIATAHGALHGILGTELASWSLVLGSHVTLGVLSLWWLDRGVRSIQHRHQVPRFFGVFGGVLVPLPVFVFALLGCNVDWLGAGPTALVACTLLVFAAHVLSYRAGRKARQLRAAP